MYGPCETKFIQWIIVKNLSVVKKDEATTGRNAHRPWKMVHSY